VHFDYVRHGGIAGPCYDTCKFYEITAGAVLEYRHDYLDNTNALVSVTDGMVVICTSLNYRADIPACYYSPRFSDKGAAWHNGEHQPPPEFAEAHKWKTQCPEA